MVIQVKEVADNWLELLFRACLVLSRTSDKTVRSVSVTIPNSSPQMLHLLTSVSERLSKTYGLYATVEQEEPYFSIRFSRQPVSKGSLHSDSTLTTD